MKLCNDCGKEISGARAAIPWATLCRDCQESLERQGIAVTYRPPATAIAVLSEEDDSTRVIEEGWHRERLAI